MDSGQLRASITHEVKGNSVLVGTNKEYGAAHQFGAKIPPHTIQAKHAKALFWGGAAHPVKKVSLPEINIPARPFIVVQDEDKQEILSAISRYLL
jgi:phage gpG-like protein